MIERWGDHDRHQGYARAVFQSLATTTAAGLSPAGGVIIGAAIGLAGSTILAVASWINQRALIKANKEAQELQAAANREAQEMTQRANLETQQAAIQSERLLALDQRIWERRAAVYPEIIAALRDFLQSQPPSHQDARAVVNAFDRHSPQFLACATEGVRNTLAQAQIDLEIWISAESNVMEKLVSATSVIKMLVRLMTEDLQELNPRTQINWH